MSTTNIHLPIQVNCKNANFECRQISNHTKEKPSKMSTIAFAILTLYLELVNLKCITYTQAIWDPLKPIYLNINQRIFFFFLPSCTDSLQVFLDNRHMKILYHFLFQISPLHVNTYSPEEDVSTIAARIPSKSVHVALMHKIFTPSVINLI